MSLLPPPPKNDKISSAFSYNFKSALTVAPVAVSVTVVSDEQLRIYMSHGVRQKGFALLHIHGGAEKGFDILFFAAFFVFPVTAQDIVYFIRRQRNRTLRAGTPCFLYLFFCREQAQLP